MEQTPTAISNVSPAPTITPATAPQDSGRFIGIRWFRHGFGFLAWIFTGFGLIGHAAQMADASGVSMRLAPRPDWFLPRTLELAAEGVVPAGLHKNREFYGAKVGGETLETGMGLAIYDPQTSGGLLIAVPARRAASLVAALKRRRAWVAEIGEVTKRGRRSIELTASAAR